MLEKEKNIIVVSQFINGGVENLIISIIQKRKDMNFYIISLRDNIYRELLERLPENATFIECEAHNLLKRMQFFYGYIKRYLKDCKNIIDFHEVLITELFTLLFKKYKNCWHWFNTNPWMKKGRRFYKLYYFLLKKFDKIICICEIQKEELLKIIPSYRNSIVVCNNFIDIKRIEKLSEDNLPENNKINSKYIVSVARIDYGAKDFETIIKAYEMLPDSISASYKLVIVGDGPDMPVLKERVMYSSKSENIILTGNLNNPYPIVKNADLFIMSSFAEGFSLVLLEAMALNIPVISSNCLCGPVEIIDNEKYGLLYKIGDYKELSKKIQDLITNKKLQEQYKEKGLLRLNYYCQKSEIELKELFIEGEEYL